MKARRAKERVDTIRRGLICVTQQVSTRSLNMTSMGVSVQVPKGRFVVVSTCNEVSACQDAPPHYHAYSLRIYIYRTAGPSKLEQSYSRHWVGSSPSGKYKKDLSPRDSGIRLQRTRSSIYVSSSITMDHLPPIRIYGPLSPCMLLPPLLN